MLRVKLKKFMCLLLVVVFCCGFGNATLADSAQTEEAIVEDDYVETIENSLPEAVRMHITEEKQASLKSRSSADEASMHDVVLETQDGNKLMYLFEKPVKYETASGEVRDKSTSLTATKNGFSMLDNSVAVSFPAHLSDGIVLNYAKYKLELIPQNITGTAQLTDNKVAYFDKSKNIIFGYTPLLDGYKEDIVLLKPSNLTEICFSLKTNGLDIVSSGNQLHVVAEDERIAVFSSLYVYDSKGSSFIWNMTCDEIRENQEYVLKIDLKQMIENHGDLQYPVTIDPSVTICEGVSGIEHAMVYSGYPTGTNMCSTLGESRHTIGYYDSTRKVGYELIRFPGLYTSDAFLNGDFIANVTYHQYYVPRNTEHTVTAYLYNSIWIPSAVTYQTLGTNSLDITSSVSFSSASSTTPTLCSIDLTEFAWYWKANPTSRAKGIILKNANITDSTKCAYFMANEIQSTPYYYYSPYLTAEYSVKKIMLDAGHCIGANTPDIYPQYSEGTQMWKLHLMLKAELETYGFEVGTTRTEAEKTLDPDEVPRGEMSAGYDMFLSLHSNASSSNPEIDKVWVIYDWQDKNNASVFAETLGIVVRDVMNVSDYDPRTKTKVINNQTVNHHGVLRGAAGVAEADDPCPLYYIIEHSFHTYLNSAIWLNSDANLQLLAEAEAKAIAEFYKTNG